MARNERENLFHDLAVESVESLRAMSPVWRVALVAGLVGFVASRVFGPPHAALLLSVFRVVALAALTAGCIAYASVIDEFYQRIYLHACTYAFIASTLILYGLYEFGVDLGVRTVSVVLGTFVIACVAAFVLNRRG
jgi:hypothetical protein